MAPYRGPERRGSPKPDIGERRRTDDDLVERIASWMESHDDWARDLAARLDQRLQSVEDRADLLDGRKIGGGGIIGTLGKLEERVDTVAGDVKDIKTKTGAQDGQKPPGRWERIFTVLGPILIVLITTIGGIVIAYFALRGQLAGLQTGGGR